MSANLTATANQIINRVAVETGLPPSADPYASQDEAFKQLQYLLNICGEELSQLYPWEFLVGQQEINTNATDSGNYPLPDDFLYMLNQTGWDRTNNVPLFGPISAQQWQYLLGRDLVTETIYASYRIKDGMFSLFPQPPADGVDIFYEYVGRNWVLDSTTGDTLTHEVMIGGDTPLFNSTLISRLLKVKFLEAKGFDTAKAQDDFNAMYQQLTSHDKSAPILNGGRSRGAFPYLNGYYSTPDSGFGR